MACFRDSDSVRARARSLVALVTATFLSGLLSLPAGAQGPFINWENPPVHPIDVSPSNALLAVANLPDNRVELYDLDAGVPLPKGRVGVGLDPVTARFRNDSEVWVVNHVSDSISVVDVATMRVRMTIPTGDEPCDVVFVAGSPQLAFVSCSQINAVQVFNAGTGALLSTVAINGEDPRSLAVSADGTKVYAAIFESGNASTLIGGGMDDTNTLVFPGNAVSDPLGPYGGVNPPPNVGGVNGTFSPAKNPDNGTPPAVGLIVKKDAQGRWMDDNGQDWTLLVSGPSADRSGRPVGWDLPDRDLAIIDTSSLNVTYARGLMNICMSASVHPTNGRVYVIGTDATNEIRFEPNVNGKFTRVKVASVNPANGAVVANVDLNPHLTYASPQIAQAQRDRSLGDPRGIVWNADGTRGYVTGMGSNNLIVIDANGARIAGTGATPVELAEGPTGLAIANSLGRLYVLERFGGSIAVLDPTSLSLLHRVRYFDPTPGTIKVGRKHLYDTHKNSGLGQIACASCHVDGRMDRLAWDLGDPAGELDPSDNQNNLFGSIGSQTGVAPPIDAFFHPMKGPMLTQTLQDIIGKEPHHWRGDRDGIEHFNGAFFGLQGDDANLTPAEMQEFEDFLATIHFPPNPYRNFDNTLPASLPLTGFFRSGRFGNEGQPLPTGSATRGLQIYRTGTNGTALDAQALDCVSCHTLPTGASPNRQAGGSIFSISFNVVPTGPNGEKHLGLVSIDGSTQDAIKVAQLRNLYERTGFELTAGNNLDNNAGFGYTHDGAVDTIPRFVSEPVFSVANDQDVADLTAFMLSFAGSDLPMGNTSGTIFPRNLEPRGEPSNDSHAGTGRQVTVTSSAGDPFLSSMIAEANESGTGQTRGVDLVVKGRVGGVERGWWFNNTTSNNFLSDRDSEPGIPLATLLNLAGAGSELTFTVVPRGSGRRIGADRDGDGFGDRTELDAFSDPSNPAITPQTGVPELSVAPASLDFGVQTPNAGAGAAQVVTVSNVGTGPLIFTGPSFAITGPDASQFRISNSPADTPIAASGSRAFNVVFDPSSDGVKNAFLAIVTNDTDETVTKIALTGTAASVMVPVAPDECANAMCLGDGIPVTYSNAGATGADLSTCGLLDRKDVWFTYTPSVTEAVNINTIGSVLDTTISVFAGCSGTQVACNDNGAGIGTASSVTPTLNAGTTYRIRVAGANDATGVFTIVVNGGLGGCVLSSPNQEAEGRFGVSVVGGNDMTGDGTPDLMIGAYWEDPGSAPYDSGMGYLFSGSTLALSRQIASPTRVATGFFGRNVRGIGDVDEDGLVDFVSSAPGETAGAVVDAGQVHLYSGGTGALIRTFGSPNAETGGQFGARGNGVNDVTGDGKTDVLVSAPFEDPGASPADSGRVYVFNGVTGALFRTYASPNPEAGGQFGVNVIGIKDVTGDGRGELFVGAMGENPSGLPNDAGMVYMLNGATGAVVWQSASPIPRENGLFGKVVSRLDDVTGDGKMDVAVGAPDEFGGGRVHLFNGATGAHLRTIKSPNSENLGLFGQSITNILDANGDGWGDLVVGAPAEDGGGLSDSGRAYVFSGRNGALLRMLTSPQPDAGAEFGFSVGTVPDLDGNGYAEFLIGARRADPGTAPADAGRAYLFYGKLLP